MDDLRQSAWKAVDVLDAEAAAHYLSGGEPNLKRTVLRQMEADYANAISRLHEEAAKHIGIEGDPGSPHGLVNEPLRLPDTPVYQLRSIAFEETEDRWLHEGPEQAFEWARSDVSRFGHQRFRRTEVEAWAENRGFWRQPGPGTTRPLHPKENTALLAIIGLLARVHGLPLERHSAAAAQLIKEAGEMGIIPAPIGQRSLEVHLKEAFDQIERNPQGRDNSEN